jgi:hypothetical protein
MWFERSPTSESFAGENQFTFAEKIYLGFLIFADLPTVNLFPNLLMLRQQFSPLNLSFSVLRRGQLDPF